MQTLNRLGSLEYQTTKSDFCRAMLCISAAIVGMRCLSVCLSVCPSVCHVRELRQNE